MKKIIDHLRNNWIKHGFETLVVVVGILVAFTLNNWNQKRLEYKEEIQILNNLKADLQNAIHEFQFLNGLRHRLLKGTYGILEIAAEGSFESSKERLDTLFGLTLIRPTYNNQLGALDLLFTSGKINLISNDEIKNSLIAYPGEIDDMVEEEVYANELFEGPYYNTLANYVIIDDIGRTLNTTSILSPQAMILDSVALDRTVMKSDYRSLLTQRGFLNHLNSRASNIKITLIETEALIQGAQEIIKMIDEELAD